MAITIGCAVWTFTEPAHNPPYEEAIGIVGELGFDRTELILRDFDDIDGYWSGDRPRAIGELLKRNGLELSQFAMFQNVMSGLASLVPEERSRSMEAFKAGCGIARQLDCSLVNFVSPWPEVVTSPNPYLPEYYYINVPGVDPRLRILRGFQTKLRVDFPRPFDAEAYWQSHVDAVQTVSDIAADHGLELAIENHANTMTPHTESLLRLMEHADRPNLGVNLDTVWAFVQREHVPTAIRKLGARLLHVHVRDGDGLAAYNLPVGQGATDWVEVFRALRIIGYDGTVSIEWAHDSRARANAERALSLLRELADEAAKAA
ncbi:MAG: sugar phosphate isomerase/epimerase family protein [Microbacterium sp.]|uniref:sugar phosphate isomerase/epimerase family protein n=1 Tax=Microbacterium sp. TaxID=51671 RepID=UPI0039E3929C